MEERIEISGRTWNGALSNENVGNDKFARCLEYWSKSGTYTNRSQEAVNADMEKIFGDDTQVATAVVFGTRLITRKPNVGGIEETQTGYGRRDEFYKAIVWLHHNQPDLLYRNLRLIPVFGCWRDFFTEPLIDVLDRDKVYNLVVSSFPDPLLLKYLPQGHISLKAAKTEREKKRLLWARGLCEFMGISARDYRKMKSSGTGHIFQKQMSNKEWDKVNFNGIPGKAMFNATMRKGRDGKSVFERHEQVERLKEWVLKQPTVKFTGYPYELTKAARTNTSLLQRFILDKQFQHLLEPMKNHKLGNVLAALDTSGSMSWHEFNGATPLDICLSMGLVFSSLNVGWFKDTVVAFADKSRLVRLEGEFTQRCSQVSGIGAMGSTNFQSVIDLLVQIRKENPEIPVDQYPETLLVISDMQFNPASYGHAALDKNEQTNYQVAMRKLQEVGLGDMRIIWWWVNGAATDFPVQMHDKGVYMIGGFDPINIKSLMGLNADKKEFVAAEKKEETPLDGLFNFLRQPIFGLLQV